MIDLYVWRFTGCVFSLKLMQSGQDGTYMHMYKSPCSHNHTTITYQSILSENFQHSISQSFYTLTTGSANNTGQLHSDS